jgi:heme-degrading monooxygenase HmoA
MFLAIFEIRPKTERFNDYLALAKRLRPILEKVDGFVENERFESRRRPGWILSLSTWRDEKSMVRWRTTGVHHIIQQQGRTEIFEDYHLRIGDVIADTHAPSSAPVHEQRFDETEIGAKFATVTELSPRQGTPFGSQIDIVADLGLDISEAVIDHDVFTSIYNPGKLALLALWRDPISANAWIPRKSAPAQMLRHRRVRIVRDYGMFDRREAPQFFSDAKGSETKHAVSAK